MKWLSRTLWLAVWSFWLWLGFGLYRELPRDLGPVVCQLPLAAGEQAIGFLERKPVVVTCERDLQNAITVFRLRNAMNGAEQKRMSVECLFDGCSLHKAGLVALNYPVKAPQGHRPTKAVLDAASGAIQRLQGQVEAAAFHPSRPWAALYTPYGDDDPGSVEVIDLRTGMRLFECNRKSGDRSNTLLTGPPCFIGDQILVSRRLRNGMDDAVELWPLSKSRGPVAHITEVEFRDGMAASEAGVVAGTVRRKLNLAVEVWGIDGKLRFREPEGRNWLFATYHKVPILAASGRTVYSFLTDRLYEVTTGRILWERREYESVIPLEGVDRFETVESVAISFGSWRRSFYLYAQRDLNTGALLFRTWRRPRSIQFDGDSHSGLCIVDNEVRSMPPPNYPLLAFCQTILALPLILLWAVLRWRRRRRARMASVAP